MVNDQLTTPSCLAYVKLYFIVSYLLSNKTASNEFITREGPGKSYHAEVRTADRLQMSCEHVSLELRSDQDKRYWYSVCARLQRRTKVLCPANSNHN